jgi:uncharacterized protein
MDPLVKAHRQEILAVARKRGAERIRVFGSMATNHAKSSSDVDFLVDMEKGKSAFALGGLLKDLEDILGRQVDITTPNALHPAIREEILRQAVDL